MICDDALSSAIDSRKFAAEFCARRRADLEGRGYDGVSAGGDWSVVGGGKSASAASLDHNVSGNVGGGGSGAGGDGFEVVGKKKKGKK